MANKVCFLIIVLLIVDWVIAIRLSPQLQAQSTPDLLCTTGKLQSPINIQRSYVAYQCGSSKLQLFGLDRAVEASILRNESVLQVSTPFAFAYAQFIDMESVPALYSSRRIRFHFPSEHRIDGRQYAAEIQLAFNISGDFDAWQKNLVISVLLDLDTNGHGDSSHTVLDMINLLQVASFQLSVQDVLLNSVRDHNFYFYQGSLTESPCSQIVNWLVSDQILSIRQQHLKLLLSLNDGKTTNREVQDIGTRMVYQVNSSCNFGTSIFSQQYKSTTITKVCWLLAIFILAIIAV